MQVKTSADGNWEKIAELNDYPATTAANAGGLKGGETFTCQFEKAVTVFGVRVVGKPACGDDGCRQDREPGQWNQEEERVRGVDQRQRQRTGHERGDEPESPSFSHRVRAFPWRGIYFGTHMICFSYCMGN